jgi:argininosuccinate lyase
VTFDPLYVSNVLRENFEDAKTLFLRPLLSIHYAHLVMLVDRGIVTSRDASALRDALDAISATDLKHVTFDGKCEDLFFYIERLITEQAGEDVAGRLHTARSRNDIDMTMYRMRQRECLLDLIDGATDLRCCLIGMAERHRQTVFAALTHTQPAQPTTVAHYLLAVIEQLERDTVRLRAAYASTNCCPLGSCAITGTGFPINRQLTSDLLGFDAPTGNTYGSIATADYLLESVSATAVMLVGLGRVLQDLLQWCTAEFGYLRLSDGFVQCSSIMPQKRNPVGLEHARALTSKALGQAQAVVFIVHNTPFGDIVDTEDDLQPLVQATFTDALRALRLVAAAMRDAEFVVDRMEHRAATGGTTLTELADQLVRDHGVPFRTAHGVAIRLLPLVEGDQISLSERLSDAALELVGIRLHYTDASLTEILSAHHFVEVRTTPGGPASSATTAAIKQSQGLLAADTLWLQQVREHITSAEHRLRDRTANL